MYLLLCAINHGQHICPSTTEPQLSLSLTWTITPPAPPPHQTLPIELNEGDMIWTWPPPQHSTKPTPQVPKEFHFPRTRHLRGRDFGLVNLSCRRVSNLDANCQGTQWSMMEDKLNCNQILSIVKLLLMV